jgi:multidrug efflux pump subunit AcrA (membrane-fusion protein)
MCDHGRWREAEVIRPFTTKGGQMRRPIIIFGVLGVVLLAAAALWSLFAPAQLVKYPDDLNQTAVAMGTVRFSSTRRPGPRRTRRRRCP